MHAASRGAILGIQVLGLLVGVAALVILALKSPIGALFALPVLAWYASRVLVRGGEGLWGWARRGHLGEWNGRYYEFGTVHLRALEIEGALVFVEEDILTVLGQRESQAVKLFGAAERFPIEEPKGAMALTEAGCERLLIKSVHRDAKKLLLFLRREAFFPHSRRRA